MSKDSRAKTVSCCISPGINLGPRSSPWAALAKPEGNPALTGTKPPLPLRSALQYGSGRKSAAVGLPGTDHELDFASSSPLHSKCG